MPNKNILEITTLDRIDGDAVVVGFSDGTVATFGIEELLALRPSRDPAPETPRAEDPGSPSPM